MSGDRSQVDVRTEGAHLVDLDAWSRVEIAGADRASFLHNFCTNEIRKRSPGEGCEAFVTDAKGKILAYVFVLVLSDRLLLLTVPGQASAIIQHLDRYVITEDVALRDVAGSENVVLISGPRSAEIAAQFADVVPAQECWSHSQSRVGDHSVTVARADLFGPDDLVFCGDRAAIKQVGRQLQDAGATACDAGRLEAARIEQGTPWYGRDIAVENLPQEVDRDARAISFVKGCYLGQETVARIDALGHVNKKLVGLQFDAAAPPPLGTALAASGQPVGTVTSSALSSRLNVPVALAVVRRGHDAPNTPLESACGRAAVVELPMQ